jgi:hypothetical protein
LERLSRKACGRGIKGVTSRFWIFNFRFLMRESGGQKTENRGRDT